MHIHQIFQFFPERNKRWMMIIPEARPLEGRASSLCNRTQGPYVLQHNTIL